MGQSPTRLGPAVGITPWRLVRLSVAALRPSPLWAYTLRVLLAVALAMYAAYWLELDSPYSAGTTVLVLMNVSRGAVISKSVWRLAGSIVGAAAAVVLIALFAQTPVLFVFGLAAWIGFCSAIGSLLRYNRSYGAVLAGYTVTLVVFGAIADPNRIFDLATARVAVVTIGVISTTLVFLITDIGPGQSQLEERVAALVMRAAGLLRDALQTGDIDVAIQTRTRLAADLAALDQVVEFASVENAGFGRFAGDLRLAVAELLAALTGGLHAVTLARRLETTDRDVGAALAEGLGCVADATPERTAADLRRSVAAARHTLARQAEMCRDVATLAALDQAVTLLDQLAAALESLQALQEGTPRVPPIRLRNYVNFVTAWRNCVRATLAISMAGLFWIITAWPDGSSSLVVLGPICALATQTDSAAQATVDFLIGIALSVIGALICTYAILPQVTGFPLLMAGMLPFIAVGVYLSRQPRFAVICLGYLVFFVTLVGPNNPMRYDLAASLNTYAAFLIGSLWAVLAFRVLYPPNRRAEAAVLAHSLRNDVQRLVRRRRPPHGLVWEHLQHQKLRRLSVRLSAEPIQHARAISSGTAAVMIGRHLLSLRRAITDATLPKPVRDAASRTITSFHRLRAAPSQAAMTARNEAIGIASASASQRVFHMAATLHDLAELVTEHTDFFARATLLGERSS